MTLNPPFTIKVTDEEDLAILALTGQFIKGEAITELRNKIRQNVFDGKRKFVLDLEKVEDIDGAGLVELVTTLTYVRHKEGDLKLASLTEQITHLFHKTELFNLFDVFGDRHMAISSFQFT